MTAQFAGLETRPEFSSDASRTPEETSPSTVTALTSNSGESGVSTPASPASAHEPVSSTVLNGQETPPSTVYDGRETPTSTAFNGQETPTSTGYHGRETPTPTADHNGSPTSDSASNRTLSSDEGISQSAGLTSSAKIGLGIGLGVGLPLLIVIAALCLLALRKRQHRRAPGPYGPVTTNEKALDGRSLSSTSPPHEMHAVGSRGPFLAAADMAPAVHADRRPNRPDPHRSPPPSSAAGGRVSLESPLSPHHGAYQRRDLGYTSPPRHDPAPRLDLSVARPSLSVSETDRLDLHGRDPEESRSPVSPVSNLSPVTSRPASLMRGEAG
ncbi:hypothetical protein Tdes44962_MAKER09662 [Teratosphaeria destructans]|uniref:Mid2 domain-containing protein n=1 Tax=Teratosphaeria destructans TaxID=418781 RepID=A0A9W7SSE6_9PEZI|nr:hypothetical protein Tdes44962_MAKER09662 [Teratosphaeria destructans]